MAHFTQEEIKERIQHTCGDEFSLVGEYKANYLPVRVRHNCDKCRNFEWNATPKNTFMRKKLVCPACSGKNAYLNRDKFLTPHKIKNLLGEHYELIGSTSGRKDLAMEVHHICDKCEHTHFYVSPNKILKCIEKGEEFCPICRCQNAKKNKKKGKKKGKKRRKVIRKVK